MALGKAAELPAEDGEIDGKNSDSESSSGVFGWTTGREKQKQEGKPRAAKRKKNQQDAPEEPKETRDSSKASKTRESKEKTEEQAQAMKGKIATFKSFLANLSLLGLWNGSVKLPDCKLSKVYDLAAQASSSSNEEIAALALELQEQADSMSQTMEFLYSLRQQKDSLGTPAGELSLALDLLAKMIKLPNDALNAVLTDFGRKLTEASCRGRVH